MSQSFTCFDSDLFSSIEREALLLDMGREALDEDLTTDDIHQRELSVDKEIVQLIQAACKADNSARVIELCKLLHHTANFDLAEKVAGFYHLVGLQEKIGMLRADREDGEDRLVAARNRRKQWMKPAAAPRQLPNVDSPAGRPKAFQDFGPPRAIHRPNLGRATPKVETTRYSAAAAPSSSATRIDSPPPSSYASPADSKRKRSDDDDDESVVADDSVKRRAVDTEMAPPPMPKSTSSSMGHSRRCVDRLCFTENPFARKPVAEGSTSRNPFGRKLEPSKGLQKSESFFEKVDAAETEKRPAKRE